MPIGMVSIPGPDPWARERSLFWLVWAGGSGKPPNSQAFHDFILTIFSPILPLRFGLNAFSLYPDTKS